MTEHSFRNYLAWLKNTFSSTTLDARAVAEHLQGYGFSDAELQQFAQTPLTQRDFKRIVKLRKRERLKIIDKERDVLLDGWNVSNSRELRILLTVCQELVGSEVIHPIFQPISKLLRASQRGTDNLGLAKLLIDDDKKMFQAKVGFDSANDLVVEFCQNSGYFQRDRYPHLGTNADISMTDYKTALRCGCELCRV